MKEAASEKFNIETIVHQANRSNNHHTSSCAIPMISWKMNVPTRGILLLQVPARSPLPYSH